MVGLGFLVTILDFQIEFDIERQVFAELKLSYDSIILHAFFNSL